MCQPTRSRLSLSSIDSIDCLMLSFFYPWRQRRTNVEENHSEQSHDYTLIYYSESFLACYIWTVKMMILFPFVLALIARHSSAFSLFFLFPPWVFLAVAVFSVMIDVSVSPPRFRKMSTSLARPTLECWPLFLPFIIFFFFCSVL